MVTASSVSMGQSEPPWTFARGDTSAPTTPIQTFRYSSGTGQKLNIYVVNQSYSVWESATLSGSYNRREWSQDRCTLSGWKTMSGPNFPSWLPTTIPDMENPTVWNRRTRDVITSQTFSFTQVIPPRTEGWVYRDYDVLGGIQDYAAGPYPVSNHYWLRERKKDNEVALVLRLIAI
jgi:hypothetical protein